MTAVNDRLASALSERYGLERELGVGGSAAVFLARDLRHRRPVDLNTDDLEAAADWYQRMIDHRDPFCLVYAMGDATRPLRQHPRWKTLREQMNLPRTGAD